MCRYLSALAVVGGVAVSGLAVDPKDEFKLTPAEQMVLELTNQVRKKEKLPLLTANPKLTQAARLHSANMARQEKLEHKLDGKGVGDRVLVVGYQFKRLGENLAFSEELLVKDVFDNWMKSEVHRVNILKNNFEEIGIGLFTNAKGEVYYTQVFGTALANP